MYISEEAYERVNEAIDDLSYVCNTRDDPGEWEDVASSSVTRVLEELDADCISMTCEAFRETIADSFCKRHNFALGLGLALIRSLRELLDYYSDSCAIFGAGQRWDEEEERFIEDDDRRDLREAVEKELELTEKCITALSE